MCKGSGSCATGTADTKKEDTFYDTSHDHCSARRTLRIVHQNIVFALGIKALCLLLGALGIAGMWAAIFADVGVMVIAVLNATRALYTKDLTKN